MGMAAGTAMVMSQKLTAVFPLHIGGATFSSYAAVNALVLNLIIAVALTLVLNAWGANRCIDETSAPDYEDSESELSAERLIKEYPASQVSK